MDAVENGGTRYQVTRGMHSSPAAAHAAQAAVYPLQSKTVIAAFPPDFFGSPYSGSWSQADDAAGRAGGERGVVRDERARQQSGEEHLPDQHGGPGAADAFGRPVLDSGGRLSGGGRRRWLRHWWWRRHTRCGISSRCWGGRRMRRCAFRVDVDGAAYCTLSIPAGMTTSPAADGTVAGPLAAGREGDAGGAGGGTDLSGREPDGADSTLMAEQLTKLRPDRDLQCYFERPSAVAALSGASANGFTVSGCWRQQFDWAVIEWNRDNVFEHPALRNLPDGDLSGLQLSYRRSAHELHPAGLDALSDGGLAVPADLGGIRRDGDAVQGPVEELCDRGGRIYGRDGEVRVAGDADSRRLHRTGLAGSTLQLPTDGQRHAGERRQRAGGGDHGESGDGSGERHGRAARRSC